MFEAKKISSKIIPGVIVIVVVIGIYIWWDKKQYNQCKSLLSLLSEEYSSTMVTLNRDRIIDCYQRVYGVDLIGRKSSMPATPLKPDKDVYTVGEKITYGYLTLQVKGTKKVGLDLTGLDVYVYNSKDNPRDIYITEGQFFLETSDKIRLNPLGYTNFGGRHLKPDEGYDGTLYFSNNSIQQSDLLKMIPFEGSPALTINLSI